MVLQNVQLFSPSSNAIVEKLLAVVMVCMADTTSYDIA